MSTQERQTLRNQMRDHARLWRDMLGIGAKNLALTHLTLAVICRDKARNH